MVTMITTVTKVTTVTVSDETQDYRRRKALTESDVTCTVDILVFVRSKVSELQQAIGPESFYKLSEGVDKSITDQITEILS